MKKNIIFTLLLSIGVGKISAMEPQQDKNENKNIKMITVNIAKFNNNFMMTREDGSVYFFSAVSIPTSASSSKKHYEVLQIDKDKQKPVSVMLSGQAAEERYKKIAKKYEEAERTQRK